MAMSPKRRACLWGALPVALAVAGYVALPGPGPNTYATIVSQKGRKFSVASLNISTGSTIRIVNDDADLQHHVYVDTNTFRFDSGDQDPGSSTDIVFSVPGTFPVLCGIHPKMKLVMTVK